MIAQEKLLNEICQMESIVKFPIEHLDEYKIMAELKYGLEYLLSIAIIKEDDNPYFHYSNHLRVTLRLEKAYTSEKYLCDNGDYDVDYEWYLLESRIIIIPSEYDENNLEMIEAYINQLTEGHTYIIPESK